MVKKISSVVHMLIFGTSTIRLCKKYSHRYYATCRTFLTAEERWGLLLNRLKEATCKVVEQYERG